MNTFSGSLAHLVYFSAWDRHVWLAGFSGSNLNWSLVDVTTPNAPTELGVNKLTAYSVSLIWGNTNRAGDSAVSIDLERKTGASGTYSVDCVAPLQRREDIYG